MSGRPVITSYSIHYTKLYERISDAGRGARRDVGAGLPANGACRTGGNGVMDARPAVTSRDLSADDYTRFSEFLERSCGILLGEHKHYLRNNFV